MHSKLGKKNFNFMGIRSWEISSCGIILLYGHEKLIKLDLIFI